MKNVLLTSAGPTPAMVEKIFSVIGKAPRDIKVLFVPTAAVVADEAREGIAESFVGLMQLGILLENITTYHLGYVLSKGYKRTYSAGITDVPAQCRLLTAEELSAYDMILVCGGYTDHLMQEMTRTGFTEPLKAAVENGLFYVGVSAGSMVAAGNYPEALHFIDNALIPHCPEGTPCGTLPESEVLLTDGQAVWITNSGAEIIE